MLLFRAVLPIVLLLSVFAVSSRNGIAQGPVAGVPPLQCTVPKGWTKSGIPLPNAIGIEKNGVSLLVQAYPPATLSPRKHDVRHPARMAARYSATWRTPLTDWKERSTAFQVEEASHNTGKTYRTVFSGSVKQAGNNNMGCEFMALARASTPLNLPEVRAALVQVLKTATLPGKGIPFRNLTTPASLYKTPNHTKPNIWSLGSRTVTFPEEWIPQDMLLPGTTPLDLNSRFSGLDLVPRDAKSEVSAIMVWWLRKQDDPATFQQAKTSWQGNHLKAPGIIQRGNVFEGRLRQEGRHFGKTWFYVSGDLLINFNVSYSARPANPVLSKKVEALFKSFTQQLQE
jgi:hypothetical protein